MMNTTLPQPTTHVSMSLLSRLLLRRDGNGAGADFPELGEMGRDQFEQLVLLADLNHVIVRGLEVVLENAHAHNDQQLRAWAEDALGLERARINTALIYLQQICSAFEIAGHDVAVIKSLDH